MLSTVLCKYQMIKIFLKSPFPMSIVKKITVLCFEKHGTWTMLLGWEQKFVTAVISQQICYIHSIEDISQRTFFFYLYKVYHTQYLHDDNEQIHFPCIAVYSSLWNLDFYFQEPVNIHITFHMWLSESSCTLADTFCIYQRLPFGLNLQHLSFWVCISLKKMV